MAENKRSFGKTTGTNTLKVWDEFKKENPEYADIPSSELKTNIEQFFKQATTYLVDEEHGVILNGLGYFANAVYNKRNYVYDETRDKAIDNSLTDGAIYNCKLFPRVFKKNHEFLFWSFRITRHAARRMSNNIINKGVRYKCQSAFLTKFNKNHKTFLNDKPSR